jgi:hypothetical protein
MDQGHLGTWLVRATQLANTIRIQVHETGRRFNRQTAASGKRHGTLGSSTLRHFTFREDHQTF